MDTVFRTKSETPAAAEETPAAPKTVNSPVETGIEVPYTDYHNAHGHPYSVDYFKLGDNWEAFDNEVSVIEDYLGYKIDNGDIANSVKAITNELKRLEKMNNLRNEERPVVKTGVLSAYVRFLMEADGVKRLIRKYEYK